MGGPKASGSTLTPAASSSSITSTRASTSMWSTGSAAWRSPAVSSPRARPSAISRSNVPRSIVCAIANPRHRIRMAGAALHENPRRARRFPGDNRPSGVGPQRIPGGPASPMTQASSRCGRTGGFPATGCEPAIPYAVTSPPFAAGKKSGLYVSRVHPVGLRTPAAGWDGRSTTPRSGPVSNGSVTSRTGFPTRFTTQRKRPRSRGLEFVGPSQKVGWWARQGSNL